MIEKISLYFLFFMVYSFLGWIVEIIDEFFYSRKFINRGFLIGPYLPIYGFGGLFISLLLQRFDNKPVLLFILSICICSVLEYFTSYVLEKIFNARWWDYSRYKYNLNGRICLNTLIPFGLLGLFMIYFLNPIIYGLLNKLDSQVMIYLAIFLFVVFVIDFIVSVSILDLIKSSIKKFDKDNTEEITKKIKEVLSKNRLTRRLINAFPNLRYIGKKIKKNINKVLTKEQ